MKTAGKVKIIISNLISIGAIRVSWDNNNNVGDQIGPYLLRNLSNHRVSRVPYAAGRNLLSVGSILHKSTSSSIVWGSGYISRQAFSSEKVEKIFALRGNETKKIYESRWGAIGSLAFGDPAILLSDLITPRRTIKYKYGIIPHYIHENDSFINNLSRRDDLVIISVRQSVDDFIQAICECEVIFSSSLHGLICADAFEIVNYQFQLCNQPTGGQFKFIDYCSGVGKDYLPPLLPNDFSDLTAGIKPSKDLYLERNRAELRESLFYSLEYMGFRSE